MRRFVILVCFLCTTVVLSETPSERYFAELQEAQSRYRASIADEIKSADKVVVYLVNFEVTDGLDPFYNDEKTISVKPYDCLLYTSPSPRDRQKSRMPSSA